MNFPKTMGSLAIFTMTLTVACGAEYSIDPDNPLALDTLRAPHDGFIDVDDPAAHQMALTVPIATVTLNGLTARGAFPVADMIDGNTAGNTVPYGFASEADEDAGTITLTFSSDYDLTELRLYNDFGMVNHGIQSYMLTFKNSGGTTISTMGSAGEPLLNTETNQGANKGPDVLALSVGGVRSVDIEIFDNWITTTGLQESLNIREIEFEGTASPAATCDAGSNIETISLGGGLGERNASLWPVTDMCDLVTDVHDGWASNADEDNGIINVTFSSPQNLNSFEIWQDFGSSAGQGADAITIQFIGGTAGLVGPFAGDPASQNLPLISDFFMFAEQTGVTGATITIGDNLGVMTQGLTNSLNIREIRFDGYDGVGQACADNGGQISTIQLIAGLSERDPMRWPITATCDGISNAKHGYASRGNEASGQIRVDFVMAASVASMSLWNDFGSNLGQGALDGDVEIYDGMTLLGTEPFSTNAANQGNSTSSVDVVTFSTTYDSPTHAVISINDVHYQGTVPLQKSLNIREISFGM